MTDDDLETDPALQQARDTVVNAHAAKDADKAVIETADKVLSDLRTIRSDNHWAPRVRAAFRATRGAA